MKATLFEAKSMIFHLPILLHNEVQMLIKILRKQLRAELGPSFLFLLSRLVSRAGRGQSGRSATRRITPGTGHTLTLTILLLHLR